MKYRLFYHNRATPACLQTALRQLGYLNECASNAVIACVDNPTVFWVDAPPRGNPANIGIYLIFPETTVIGLHFCCW